VGTCLAPTRRSDPPPQPRSTDRDRAKAVGRQQPEAPSPSQTTDLVPTGLIAFRIPASLGGTGLPILPPRGPLRGERPRSALRICHRIARGPQWDTRHSTLSVAGRRRPSGGGRTRMPVGPPGRRAVPGRRPRTAGSCVGCTSHHLAAGERESSRTALASGPGTVQVPNITTAGGGVNEKPIGVLRPGARRLAGSAPPHQLLTDDQRARRRPLRRLCSHGTTPARHPMVLSEPPRAGPRDFRFSRVAARAVSLAGIVHTSFPKGGIVPHPTARRPRRASPVVGRGGQSFFGFVSRREGAGGNYWVTGGTPCVTESPSNG